MIWESEVHTGRKVAEDFRDNMKIVFDDYLGNWNYVAVPQCC